MMDLSELRLSEWPYHLDIVLFWAGSLAVGLGSALLIKKLADALARTDRIAASRSEAKVEDTPALRAEDVPRAGAGG